jgi:hypothetical protein
VSFLIHIDKFHNISYAKSRSQKLTCVAGAIMDARVAGAIMDALVLREATVFGWIATVGVALLLARSFSGRSWIYDHRLGPTIWVLAAGVFYLFAAKRAEGGSGIDRNAGGGWYCLLLPRVLALFVVVISLAAHDPECCDDASAP